jgi:hypothetical protein
MGHYQLFPNMLHLARRVFRQANTWGKPTPPSFPRQIRTGRYTVDDQDHHYIHVQETSPHSELPASRSVSSYSSPRLCFAVML